MNTEAKTQPTIDFGDGYTATSDGACWSLTRPVVGFSKKFNRMTTAFKTTYYPRLDFLAVAVIEYRLRAGLRDSTSSELITALHDSAALVEARVRVALEAVGRGNDVNVSKVRPGLALKRPEPRPVTPITAKRKRPRPVAR